MSRLKDTIDNQYYILECLKAFQEIVASGCCNDCNKKGKCEYEPEWGKLVRYNCPFYESIYNFLREDEDE